MTMFIFSSSSLNGSLVSPVVIRLSAKYRHFNLYGVDCITSEQERREEECRESEKVTRAQEEKKRDARSWERRRRKSRRRRRRCCNSFWAVRVGKSQKKGREGPRRPKDAGSASSSLTKYFKTLSATAQQLTSLLFFSSLSPSLCLTFHLMNQKSGSI